MGWIEQLHATLDKRVMPENIAQIIGRGNRSNSDFLSPARHELARVAAARPPWSWSSMTDDFERPADCAPQLISAARVFGFDPAGIDPADPAQVRGFVSAMGGLVGGWDWGQDWKRDRLSREARTSLHGYLAERHVERPALTTRRGYNRRIRALRNLEDKCKRMEHALHLRRLVLIGRSGFACDIPLERFQADPAAACFIAYLTARKNRRRLFTLASKENPVDAAADLMLQYLLTTPGPDFRMLMLAMVHPRPEIIGRLTDRERGELMGRWWSVMRDTSAELSGVWGQLNASGDGMNVNKLSMIVRRGMDSSTWNTMAQAYNAARTGWLNCAAGSTPGRPEFLGTAALIEPFCPGKVMRLMAADLAWWHQASGGDVDPDTKVWAFLPMPWDVIDGTAKCSRADVVAACEQMGVDPVARGWTAPRPAGAVAEFTPTPELVHGVSVADPAWAALLRRAGVFSGKSLRDEYRDGIEVPEGMITGELPVKDPTGKYLGSI
jgi:hypothetical protein